MRNCYASFLMVVGVAAAMGCESPCKPGFQRYGNECVRSPDAGDGENERDSGSEDAANDNRADGADASTGCTRNACGGCSDIVNAEKLGMPCEVGKGDCAKAGAWVCDGKDALRCSAVPGDSGEEACGGGDEDCDGKVDETTSTEPAKDSVVWYADCDGDGFAPMGATTARGCAVPDAAETQCGVPTAGWTKVSPIASADCGDDDSRAFPGQSEYFLTPRVGGSGSFDFNCDGQSTPNFDPPTLIRSDAELCKTKSLSWTILLMDEKTCFDRLSGFSGSCGQKAYSMFEGYPGSGIFTLCGSNEPGGGICNYAYAVDVTCH